MTTAAPDTVPAYQTDVTTKTLKWLGRYGALLVLAVLVVTMSLIEPDSFATWDNLLNILNQSALTAIIAMGVTFVLVSGDFDVSIGYVASLAGVVACTTMAEWSFGAFPALLAAIVLGAVFGAANGLIVTRLQINALVATLGVGTVAIGFNYIVSKGSPVAVPDPFSFIKISIGRFLGVPYPVYLMLAVAAVLWFVLNRTVFGQSLQACGGNAVAAGLSGVRVNRTRVYAFVISGTCAGATGFLLATRTGSAAVTGGDSYLLAAFAAAFFGSAVLRDGEFHILGTLVGVITVSVGFNAIALLGLQTYWQYFFQGLLLILGVGVGSLARRRMATR